MERKIGNLGLKPITATGFSHNGNPGSVGGGPEAYLSDSINLNIVYSVYKQSRTREEIAEELGMTPVFVDERIKYLEGNGFLVRQAKNRFTTYVCFDPEEYSLEEEEVTLKKQLEAAEILANSYAKTVREAIKGFKDVYIPGGNT